MTELRYCTKCLYSVPEINSSWNLRCTHPRVNASDPWALAATVINGSSCREERDCTFLQFKPCGKRGKLWEEATK